MLIKNCLAEALENISGKTFPQTILDKCETTQSVLEAFNDLYNCVVTFSGVIGSKNVTDKMAVVVKDSNGTVVTAAAKNKYSLKKGKYKYSATVTDGQPKKDVAFTITNADEQKGAKSVAITFTA